MIDDRFVLIEQACLLPLGAIGVVEGAPVRVSATGVGDGDGGAEVAVRVTGWSVRPPMPVHGAIGADAEGRRVTRWVRRSRDGWRWRDLIDVPLAEERERYLADWEGGGTQIEEAEVILPDGVTELTVRQQGTTGASLPLTITETDRSRGV